MSDIVLTTQQAEAVYKTNNTQAGIFGTIQVNNNMKAKLIDDNILGIANESAKIVVADLLSATVHTIDPEFTVMVVQ